MNTSEITDNKSELSFITLPYSEFPETYQKFMDIGDCVLVGIIILGCIANPLVPVFLCGRKIGSK